MLYGSLDGRGVLVIMDISMCMSESLLYSHETITKLYLNQLCTCLLSHFRCIQLFATPWIRVRQALLSTGFSRQEHRSGLLCPPPGDLPNSGIKPASHYLSCIDRHVLVSAIHQHKSVIGTHMSPPS